MATVRYLRSKLRQPQIHEASLARPRLVDHLRASSAPLWLISAPAGYGKSTLAVQALDGLGGRHGWVSLDRSDNDPVRFWAHVAAALIEQGDVLDEQLDRLNPDRLDETVDELIAAVESRSDRVVLVLDDLHEITNRAITDALAGVLAHPPPNLTVVAVTRVDPTLPIGRLRSRGQLAEVRGRDLAFTTDEVAGLLGRGFAAEIVDEIAAKTDGWPAALRMLAVSASSETLDRSVHDLLTAAGSAPNVADFLAAEALGVQGPETERFLVETSIVDELEPGLCDALTGRAGSLATLRALARNQVFTELIDPADNTFRYHPLFRDFLRSRALELAPERLTALYETAAAWYADRDRPSEAVANAVAAGDDDLASAVILEHYFPYSQMGLLATVLDWLETFGLDRCREHSALRHAVAWAHLNARRYDAVDEWIDPPHVDVADEPDTIDRLAVEADAIRSHRARHLGHLADALRYSAPGVRRRADLDQPADSALLGAAALARVLAGLDPTEAATETIRIGVLHDIDSSVVTGYSCLAYVASLDPSRIDDAEALADQALDFVTGPVLERFHQPALALVAKSKVAQARGLIGDAEALLTRAETIAERGEEPLQLALVLCERARIEHRNGHLDSARACLRRAGVAVGEHGGDHLRGLIRQARNATRFAPATDGKLPGAVELSDRELAVLRLLPHRLPRRELAAQLHISENTIKTHLTSIRHKLGLTGRADIVARAEELGLLPGAFDGR